MNKKIRGMGVLNSIIVILLVVNIAVDMMLYQKLSQLNENFAAVIGAASTVKTVVAGGIVDKTLLARDAIARAKESVKNLFRKGPTVDE